MKKKLLLLAAIFLLPGLNAGAVVSGWGDSLTAGSGAPAGMSYLEQFQTLSGQAIYKQGWGGSNSTWIKDQFLLQSNHWGDQYIIIWSGRNNYSSPATVKADIATMVAHMTNNNNYLIMGILNGNYASEFKGLSGYNTITTLNSDLAATYGSKYLDIRRILVNSYNPALTQDRIDFTNDIVPTSLRADNIHLINAGYGIVATNVYAKYIAVFGAGGSNTNTINILVSTSPTAALLTAANWSLGTVPTAMNDAVFNVAGGSGIRPLSTGDLTVGSLNLVTNAGTYAIRNDTAGATTNTLTLGGGGGNSVPGANANDLLYVTNGGTLNLIGTNGGGGTGRLLIRLAENGNFNIAPNASCIIGADINGGGFSLNKTGGGALTITGNFSGSGGLTNTAGFFTNNGLSTYTGPTVFTGGTNVFNSITNVGAGASALGAPATVDSGVIHFLGGILRYNGAGTCTSDRIINDFIGGQFWCDSGTVILTGGITNSSNAGITFRGNGTIVESGVINLGSGGLTHVEASTLYLTNALNPFTGLINIGNGKIFVDTIADSGVACSLGAGTGIVFNQTGNQNNTCTLQLAVTNGSSCNRAVTFNGAQNTGANGATFENTVAGTTATFSGNVTCVNFTNLSNLPRLTLTGAGHGVLIGVLGVNTNPAVGMNIIKSGQGTWAISGLNTNRGPVTVSAGTLLINGNSSGATNQVTVAGGASFGGNGTNGGSVTLSVGAFMTNLVGSPLTITNVVTLNGNTMNVGSLTALGAGDYLLLTNLAGGISGSFAGGVTVGGAGLAANTAASILTTGNAVTLHVTNTSPTYPATGTNITFAPITSNTFTLSWPTNYIGWQLRSNAVDVTLTNYWFVVPGSTNTNRMIITINPSLPNVFYRMQHP